MLTEKVLYLPDVLIAATSMFAGYALLTFNKDDFKIIKNLKMKLNSSLLKCSSFI